MGLRDGWSHPPVYGQKGVFTAQSNLNATRWMQGAPEGSADLTCWRSSTWAEQRKKREEAVDLGLPDRDALAGS